MIANLQKTHFIFISIMFMIAWLIPGSQVHNSFFHYSPLCRGFSKFLVTIWVLIYCHELQTNFQSLVLIFCHCYICIFLLFRLVMLIMPWCFLCLVRVMLRGKYLLKTMMLEKQLLLSKGFQIWRRFTLLMGTKCKIMWSLICRSILYLHAWLLSCIPVSNFLSGLFKVLARLYIVRV